MDKISKKMAVDIEPLSGTVEMQLCTDGGAVEHMEESRRAGEQASV